MCVSPDTITVTFFSLPKTQPRDRNKNFIASIHLNLFIEQKRKTFCIIFSYFFLTHSHPHCQNSSAQCTWWLPWEFTGIPKTIRRMLCEESSVFLSSSWHEWWWSSSSFRFMNHTQRIFLKTSNYSWWWVDLRFILIFQIGILFDNFICSLCVCVCVLYMADTHRFIWCHYVWLTVCIYGPYG